jgi:hypothetical protein
MTAVMDSAPGRAATTRTMAVSRPSAKRLSVIGDEGVQGAWCGACDRFDVVGQPRPVAFSDLSECLGVGGRDGLRLSDAIDHVAAEVERRDLAEVVLVRERPGLTLTACWRALGNGKRRGTVVSPVIVASPVCTAPQSVSSKTCEAAGGGSLLWCTTPASISSRSRCASTSGLTAGNPARAQ